MARSLEDMTPEESANILTILWFMKEKRFPSDVDRAIFDVKPIIFSLMDIFKEISHLSWFESNETGRIFLRWGQIVCENFDEKWDYLAKLRGEMPLRTWYQNHYLKSPLWLGLKSIVLDNDGHVCNLCNKPGNIVHHATYDEFIMMGFDIRYLWTLCSSCHHFVEFTKKKKLSQYQSGSKFEKAYKTRFAKQEG